MSWSWVEGWRDCPLRASYEAPPDADELRRPVGPLAFAGEHLAGPEWHGTMEGAVRSGREAARDVLALAERTVRG